MASTTAVSTSSVALSIQCTSSRITTRGLLAGVGEHEGGERLHRALPDEFRRELGQRWASSTVKDKRLCR